MNETTLINGIESHEYISFDIFNTLISRNTNKTIDVFKIIKQNLNNKIDIPDSYPEDRKTAEKLARKTKQGEIRLSDIYDKMDGYSDETKRILIKAELDFEELLCVKNKKMYYIFDYCRKRNKKIILISDMYLEKNFIEKILAKNDYIGFDRLYVSCEHNASKSNGRLFEIVLSDYGIKGKQLFHIGDNFKTDIISAKLRGISGFHVINNRNIYKNCKVNFEDDYRLDYDVLNSFIENNILFTMDDYTTFGYSCIGPILYGFSSWLHDNVINFKFDRIMFLAREGNIMMKSFEFMYPELKDKIKYLYVSRQSIIIASLTNVRNYDDIKNSLSLRSEETIEGFLESINMSNTKYINKLLEYGIDINDSIKKKEFIKFINDTICEIKNKAQQEKILLLSYLQQNSFEGKIAVVDIGWNGTMQNALERIAKENNINCEIHGFYYGVRKKANNKYNKSKKSGYLYNMYSHDNIENQCRGMNGLFELNFSANHGTTLGYKSDGNIIYPILGNIESSETMLSQVKKIQDGSLMFVSDAKKDYFIGNTIFNSNVYFENFRNVGINPNSYSLNLFKDFVGYNIVVSSLIRKHIFITYLFYPKLFKQDLMYSGWKIGFLKSAFKLPLPYFKIFEFLQKNKEKFIR